MIHQQELWHLVIIRYFCGLDTGQSTHAYYLHEKEKVNNIQTMQFNNNKLEPEDFYYSKEGFKVFTEAYHLKRGYCCKNNCRHCPYGFDPKRP